MYLFLFFSVEIAICVKYSWCSGFQSDKLLQYVDCGSIVLSNVLFKLLVGNDFWGSWRIGTMGNVGDAGLLLLFSIPVHYFCGPHFLPASVRFLSLFLLIEFLLSTVLLRASHMPRIILGARNTPLHSLEMYCLVRGLNNVQLKWGNVFIVNSSRLGEVTEQYNIVMCVCVCVQVCMLIHVRLFVTPWTVACQDPLVHGISQTRILEWVAFSFSNYAGGAGGSTKRMADSTRKLNPEW